MLPCQPVHPLIPSVRIFTDTTNEDLIPHMGDCTAESVLSDPESKLHINVLELKAVLLALKN